MKSKKILVFFIGIVIGIIVGFSAHYFMPKETTYMQLKKDYCIEGIGKINEGSILKFDKAFPEGFSRYVLYLNIHDAEILDDYKAEEKNMIIPYWLRNIDTTCVE